MKNAIFDMHHQLYIY